jgi:hypothetical protein
MGMWAIDFKVSSINSNTGINLVYAATSRNVSPITKIFKKYCEYLHF